MIAMPLLYEASNPQQLIIAKISRPLTNKEKAALYGKIPLIEQKSKIKIEKVTFTPTEIIIAPAKGFFVITMSVITAIAIIAAAVGLPITAWFLTQPPAPGPFGLPQYFWIGLGIGIPLIALGVTIYFIKKK